MKDGLCGQGIMNEDTSDVVGKNRKKPYHAGLGGGIVEVRFDLSAVGTAFEGLKEVSHR